MLVIKKGSATSASKGVWPMSSQERSPAGLSRTCMGTGVGVAWASCILEREIEKYNKNYFKSPPGSFSKSVD